MLPWEREYPRQTLSNPLLFLSEVIIGREKPFLSFFPSCFLLSSAALRKKKRLAMAATSVVVDVCGGEGKKGGRFFTLIDSQSLVFGGGNPLSDGCCPAAEGL